MGKERAEDIKRHAQVDILHRLNSFDHLEGSGFDAHKPGGPSAAEGSPCGKREEEILAALHRALRRDGLRADLAIGSYSALKPARAAINHTIHRATRSELRR